MKFKTIKNFSFKNKFYKENDFIELSSISEVVNLNEKGFIETLNKEQIQQLKRNFEQKEINLEEGEEYEQTSE